MDRQERKARYRQLPEPAAEGDAPTEQDVIDQIDAEALRAFMVDLDEE